MERIARLEAAEGRRITIKDCSLGMGVPIVGALIHDPSGGSCAFHVGVALAEIAALRKRYGAARLVVTDNVIDRAYYGDYLRRAVGAWRAAFADPATRPRLEWREEDGALLAALGALQERRLGVRLDGRVVALPLEAPCLQYVAPEELAIGWIEGEDRRARLSVAEVLEGSSSGLRNLSHPRNVS